MVTKTSLAVGAYNAGDKQKALKIAKGWRINVTPREAQAMQMAYECEHYPDFYASLGKDITAIIAEGYSALDIVINRMNG